MVKKRKKRMTPLSRKYAVKGSLKGCQGLFEVREVKGSRKKKR